MGLLICCSQTDILLYLSIKLSRLDPVSLLQFRSSQLCQSQWYNCLRREWQLPDQCQSSAMCHNCSFISLWCKTKCWNYDRRKVVKMDPSPWGGIIISLHIRVDDRPRIEINTIHPFSVLIIYLIVAHKLINLCLKVWSVLWILGIIRPYLQRFMFPLSLAQWYHRNIIFSEIFGMDVD